MHDAQRPLVGAAALVCIVQARCRDDTIAIAQPSGTCWRIFDAVDSIVRTSSPCRYFHCNEVVAVRFTDIVHLHDVLVVKVRCDARLVEKHPDEALILGVLGLIRLSTT